MKVVCPSCSKVIPADDIDLRGGRALCRGCSEVVFLGEAADRQRAVEAFAMIPPSGGMLPATSAHRPAEAYCPAEMRLTELREGPTFIFEVRPSRSAAVPLLGFAAVWNAFLVFWYSLALRGAGGGPWGIMLWFPLIHVGVGISITWDGLKKLLNRTRVVVGSEVLTVKQVPLPGRSVVEESARVLRFEPSQQNAQGKLKRGSSASSWSVKLLTDDGRSVSLPIELPTEDQAAYMAYRLNAAVEENRTPLTYRG